MKDFMVLVPALRVGSPDNPIIFGMEGPYISASRRPTFAL